MHRALDMHGLQSGSVGCVCMYASEGWPLCLHVQQHVLVCQNYLHVVVVRVCSARCVCSYMCMPWLNNLGHLATMIVRL